jgi:hypothetical protein
MGGRETLLVPDDITRDTSDDDGACGVADSSDYSPVSDVEQEQQGIKTEVEPEVLRMAPVQVLTQPKQESQSIRCPGHSLSHRSDTSETDVGIVTEAHRQYDTALYALQGGRW